MRGPRTTGWSDRAGLPERRPGAITREGPRPRSPTVRSPATAALRRPSQDRGSGASEFLNSVDRPARPTPAARRGTQVPGALPLDRLPTRSSMSDVVLRARARAGRVPPVEASPRGPLASGRGRDGPATYRGALDGAPRWTRESALRASAGMSCPRRRVVDCSALVPESRRGDQYAEVGNRSASYNVTTSPDRLPYPIRVRIVRHALQGRRPLRSVRQGSISTCPSLGLPSSLVPGQPGPLCGVRRRSVRFIEGWLECSAGFRSRPCRSVPPGGAREWADRADPGEPLAAATAPARGP